ncbi:MAG: hypothetical protein WCC48_15410 [Anaeromyxobacteraceae bacterium]
MTVRLCQRPRASCGACCGIYNRRDFGRAAVRAELTRHTRVLARAERTPEGFREAARRLEADAPPAVFPSIRVCQLVGFLDAAETRVGCLAHPKVTGGIDLRACGVYDVETCESFLCPSHAAFSEREASLVEAVTDFHLYGLIATDAPFVRAALEALAREAGRELELRDLEDAPLRAALRRLFALKEELAPGSDGLFGAFRHDTHRAMAQREDGLPGEADAIATVARALGADDRSGNDADLLDQEVARRFEACAAAMRAGRRPRT